MSTLGVRFPLKPDESLSGVLFRAAGEAGFLITQQMMDVAGFRHTRIETAAGKEPELAAKPKARLLGITATEVAGHFHQMHADGTCQWFGTKLRARHRDITLRRLAPMALRDANYLRAVWQLKCFPFDPRSLELLLEECPQCGSSLSFHRSLGVERCFACAEFDEFGLPAPTIDLRDFPQPMLEVKDREALNFVVDLIDPDPDVRAGFNPSLHDDLRGLTRGEIFELALALCCVAEQDTARSTTSVARPTSRDDHLRVFTPDKLAAAGRTVMRWPTGFDELCDAARSGLADRGFFGAKAELGQIYAIQVDKSLSEHTRQVAKKAIRRNMELTAGSHQVRRTEFRGRTDLITTQAASEKHGIRRKLFGRLARDPRLEVHRSAAAKGPVLFRDDQISEIAAIRDDLEAVSAVGVRLGIPPSAVRDLSEAKLIVREDGPVMHLMTGKEYYRRSSVDALIARINASTKPNRSTSKYVRLTKCMNALPPGDKPWSTVVTAILAGSLEVFQIDGRLEATLIKLATHTQGDFMEVVKDAVPSAVSPDRTVTQSEAAEILNTSTRMVSDLAALGAIPKTGLTYAAVERCAREYVFVPEISARIGVSPKLVRTVLGSRKIVPVFEVGPRYGLVFSRSQVDRQLLAVTVNE